MNQSENKHSLSSDSHEFKRLSRERYRSERAGRLHTRTNNQSRKPSYIKTVDTTRIRSKPHMRASKPKSKAGAIFTSKNIRKGPSVSTYDSQRPVIGGIGFIARRILIALAILIAISLLVVGTRYISHKASPSSVGTQMNLLSTETTEASDEDSEEDSAADDTADSDEDSEEESEEESSADTTDSSDDSE